MLVTYFLDSPPRAGLARVDSNFDLICSTTSEALVWSHATERALGEWALFGTDVSSLPGFALFIGNPCTAEVSRELAFAEEDVAFPVVGYGSAGADIFLAGVIGPSSNRTLFVRSFDDATEDTGEWSNTEVGLGGTSRATSLPSGEILVAGWTHDRFDPTGAKLHLAYVDLSASDATIESYQGLWQEPLTPRVALDADVADVPWLIYADQDVRVASLPAPGAQPCCPSISEEWLENGIGDSWALHALPDGVLAASVAIRDGDGVEDVVVTRFRFQG